MGSPLAPGWWVKLTSAPEWGIGQVQSVVGHRATVNFENAGKRTLHIDVAILEPVEVAGDES